MKTIQVSLITVLLVLMLAGCNTHLRVKYASNSGNAERGHIYYLPRTEVAIELERELRNCEVSESQIDLEITLRATLTARILPDRNHAYVIDYMTTKKGMKSTNYTVENYPNGTLKSINASIDDRTGVVLQNTIRGMLQLAGGFTSLTGTEAAAQTQPQELCKSEINILLEERKALDKNLNAWPTERQRLEETVAQRTKTLETKRAELDEAKAGGKTGGALDEYEKAVETAAANKSQAEAALNKAKAEAASKKTRRDRLRARLTVTTKVHFIPEEDSNKPIPGSESARDQWFDSTGLQSYCSNERGLVRNDCDEENTLNALRAYAAVYVPSGHSDGNGSKIQCQTEPEGGDGGGDLCKGVIYRQPATGLLLACSRKECLRSDGKLQVLSENLIASQDVVIPQLGVPAFLPLSNSAFQNNNLQATFAENGVLTKVTYSSNARAEAAAGAFEGSASDVASFLDARREAEKEKRGKAAAELLAEKERVAAQLALEQEIKKLEDFRAGIPVEEEPEPMPDDSSDGGAGSDSGNSVDDGG